MPNVAPLTQTNNISSLAPVTVQTCSSNSRNDNEEDEVLKLGKIWFLVITS
jgi:hypothetical protein